jgi:hypothetical protein
MGKNYYNVAKRGQTHFPRELSLRYTLFADEAALTANRAEHTKEGYWVYTE